MIPIILSAGRGSRVGAETKELPKWFLEIGKKHVYDYQLSALSTHFDTAYVVLGHGFTSRNNPEKVIPDRDDIEVEPLIYDGWKNVENAGTAAFALEQLPLDDDLLLICGDIVIHPDHITKLVNSYHADLQDQKYSAVGAFEGIQDDKTAVQWDNNDKITDYGAIEGHEEAGMFILNEAHITDSKSIWEANPNDWFPTVFPSIESKVIRTSRDGHYEINTASDLRSVRSELVGKTIR